MRIFFGKRATWLKGQEHRLDDLIWSLWPILQNLILCIHYGFKLKRANVLTFTAVDYNGKFHPYRLTITLDSLAGSEKIESGMTGMVKPGGSIKKAKEAL